MVDDILLQEIQSLKEQLKIAVKLWSDCGQELEDERALITKNEIRVISS